jgi:hypothetical protein
MASPYVLHIEFTGAFTMLLLAVMRANIDGNAAKNTNINFVSMHDLFCC